MNGAARKTLLLALTFVTVVTAGCGTTAVREIREDLSRPAYLGNTPWPSPKAPENVFRMEVFRMVQPILRKQTTIAGLKRDYFLNHTQQAGELSEIISRTVLEIESADKEASYIESNVRRMTPTSTDVGYQQEMLSAIKEYRAGLMEVRTNCESKYVQEITRALDLSSRGIRKINDRLRLSSG